MKINQLTQEQVDQIINLYKETQNIHEVARITGRSRVTIKKYLDDNKIEVAKKPALELQSQPRKQKMTIRQKHDKIIELYKESYNVKQISRLTGISHKTIRGCLAREGLREIGPTPTFRPIEERTYVCEYCGKTYVSKRSRGQGERFCSRDCWYAKCSDDKARTTEAKEESRIKACAICGKEFLSVHGAIFCSDECQRENARRQANKYYNPERQKQNYLAERERLGIIKHIASCHECGKEFSFWAKPENKNKYKYCSKNCGEKAHRRTSNHIRRVRVRHAKHDIITINQLMKRDHNTCQICGCKVHKQSGPFKKGKYDPTIATIDHIIPLSKGGTHTWYNVQLACADCNASKRDNMDGVQLNLFIGGAYL